MFAVVKTGGKQYRVSKGDTIKVEKLQGEIGDKIALSDVLMVAEGESVKVGRPLVEGAKVEAEIVDQGRHPKIIIFKMRRRKNYRRKAGHRQPFTALRIVDIGA
ncbi:MAG: 50S ribosomal protein L21 [Polyangia bacterium]|jgi:large subunit ribosomal protein L21|nr:50S ribosomal protein L21 [Polyangia bacterium]